MKRRLTGRAETLDAFVARVSRVHPFLLAGASGALALAAFYVPHAWFLIFVALVPLFRAIERARGAWPAFLYGTLWGFLVVGGTTFWMFSALPLPPLAHQPFFWFLLILVSWLIMLALMAPCMGAWAVAAHAMRLRTLPGACGAAFAWVAFEWLRLYAFSIASYAPGIDNPPFFSAGFIGYPLADSSAYLQLAAAGGVWLMSFVVLCANLAFYRLLARPRHAALVAAVLIFFSFLPLAPWREGETPPPATLPVGIMSVSVPPEERITGYKQSAPYAAQVQSAIAGLSSSGARVVLLPEGGRYLQTASSSSGVLLLDSWVTPGPGGPETEGYAGTSAKDARPVRAKQMLTPQGEYVIGAFQWAAGLFGKGTELRSFATSANVHPASWGDAVPISGTDARASVFFCIEMMAPGLAKERSRQEGSDALFFLMSHGSFRSSYALRTDTPRYLKVQAVEARKPLAASGDETPAYAFDAYGRTLAVFESAGAAPSGVAGLPLFTAAPDSAAGTY